MRVTSAAVTSLCLSIGISLFALYGQEAPKSQISVWDGVYTAEQAAHGQALYNNSCFSCHGADLSGDDEDPPIAGPEFLTKWKGKTADDVFEKIQRTMPSGHANTLPREATRDILAYILSVNSFPAGKTELPMEADKLTQIRMDASKPGAQLKLHPDSQLR
jgi:mono/diheme cytochrome c family protein